VKKGWERQKSMEDFFLASHNVKDIPPCIIGGVAIKEIESINFESA